MPQKLQISSRQFLFSSYTSVKVLTILLFFGTIMSVVFLVLYFTSRKKIVDTKGKGHYVDLKRMYLLVCILISIVSLIFSIILLVRYVRIFSWSPFTGTEAVVFIGLALQLALIATSAVFLFQKDYCSSDPDKTINYYGDCVCKFGNEVNGRCQCPSGSHRQGNSCFPGCDTSADCGGGSATCHQGQCCSTGYGCDDGACCQQACVKGKDGKTFCCPPERVKKDVDGNPIGCCPAGTQAVGNECQLVCFKDNQKTCDAGETCYTISGQADTLKTFEQSLINIGVDEKKIEFSDKGDQSTLTWCGKQETNCDLQPAVYHPVATQGQEVFYSCWPSKWANVTDKTKDPANLPLQYNVCVTTKTDPITQDYIDCWSKIRPKDGDNVDISACKGDCELKNVLHIDWTQQGSDDVKKMKQALAAGINFDNKEEIDGYSGHFCGGPAVRLETKKITPTTGSCTTDNMLNILVEDQALHSNSMFPYIQKSGDGYLMNTLYSCTPPTPQKVSSGFDPLKLGATNVRYLDTLVYSKPGDETTPVVKTFDANKLPSTKTDSSGLSGDDTSTYSFTDDCGTLGLKNLTNYCVWPEKASDDPNYLYKECPPGLTFLEKEGMTHGDQPHAIPNCKDTPNQPGIYNTNLCTRTGALLDMNKDIPEQGPSPAPAPHYWYTFCGGDSNKYCMDGSQLKDPSTLQECTNIDEKWICDKCPCDPSISKIKYDQTHASRPMKDNGSTSYDNNIIVTLLSIILILFLLGVVFKIFKKKK